MEALLMALAFRLRSYSSQGSSELVYKVNKHKCFLCGVVCFLEMPRFYLRHLFVDTLRQRGSRSGPAAVS